MPLRTILMIMAFSEEYNLDKLYICFRICILPELMRARTNVVLALQLLFKIMNDTECIVI